MGYIILSCLDLHSTNLSPTLTDNDMLTLQKERKGTTCKEGGREGRWKIDLKKSVEYSFDRFKMTE